MNRKIYYTELNKIQSKIPYVDIITITGFMNNDEKILHLQRYAEQINYNLDLKLILQQARKEQTTNDNEENKGKLSYIFEFVPCENIPISNCPYKLFICGKIDKEELNKRIMEIQKERSNNATKNIHTKRESR